MGWRNASFIVLGLWGSYMLFGDKAIAIQGAPVTMLFEGTAMLAVGIFGMIGHAGDFQKVTWLSSVFGLTMGALSAVGLSIQLYAMREGGTANLPVIAMITGSWPAITVVLSCLILGSRLELHQWLGVAAVAGGLVLVNWTK